MGFFFSPWLGCFETVDYSFLEDGYGTIHIQFNSIQEAALATAFTFPPSLTYFLCFVPASLKLVL
jgi:hypothetical protein